VAVINPGGATLAGCGSTVIRLDVLRSPSFSREFLLAAACCRWPPSPERNEAVARAAEGPIDWDRFLRTVRRHRVEGLAASALTVVETDAPDEVRRELVGEARLIARANLLYAAEAARLRRRFEEAGISVFFLKGLTLDVLAYGSLGIKKSRDIDVAVAPEKVEAACAILAQLGYRRIDPAPELPIEQFRIWMRLNKETNWLNDQGGIVVEIHNALVDNPRLLTVVNLASPRQEVTIAPGIYLPTLQKDELFSYLCVHGAMHGWARLKWLADLSALLKDDTPSEIERLHSESLKLMVGRCSAQALLLCADVLALPLPATMRAQLRRNSANRRLVRLALRVMEGQREKELDDTLWGTIPIHLSHLALAPGWRSVAAELRRKLRSPYDRSRWLLPRPFHWLYPALAVPSWMWRRAVGKQVFSGRSGRGPS
jgi:hypothetical protein